MVDEITEPLSAVRLPEQIDDGFGRKVVEIRDIRNKSAHFVRESSDLQKFFDAATNVLATEIKVLFDNHYRRVVKELGQYITTEANKDYKEVLGEFKKNCNKHPLRASDEIADFITLLSASESSPGVVRGIVRPAAKLSKGRATSTFSDCRRRSRFHRVTPSFDNRILHCKLV
jgi:hypothetical protein